MDWRLDLDHSFDKPLEDANTVEDCKHRHSAGEDISGIDSTEEGIEEEVIVDAMEMEELLDTDGSGFVFDLKILQLVLV